MSPRPKNSTKEKTAENRQRILDSAEKVFADKGFDGANMREIATEANVNKFMLYYHFKNKQTLFEQVLDTVTKPLFRQLSTYIAQAPTLEAALIEVYNLYAELFTRHRGRIRSFVARDLATNSPRIGKLLKLRARDIVGLWEPKIVDFIGRGPLPQREVVWTTVSIMTTIVSTFLTQPAFVNVLVVYGLSPQDPGYRDHVIRFILGGVRHRLEHVEPIRTEV